MQARWVWLCVLHLILETATAFSPKVIKTLPNVTVEAGQAFAFQVDPSTFQSNKVGGLLTYNLKDSAGAEVPSWASFSPSNISLRGIAIEGEDTQYVWTLTATDRDGEQSAQNFTFSSLAACPTGLYRHFRLRLASTNQPSYYQPDFPGSYVCSVLWSSSNETTLEASYPSAMAPAYNISGTTYTNPDHYGSSDPMAAPQEGFQSGESGQGQFCSLRNSWKVRFPWATYHACHIHPMQIVPAAYQVITCHHHDQAKEILGTLLGIDHPLAPPSGRQARLRGPPKD